MDIKNRDGIWKQITDVVFNVEFYLMKLILLAIHFNGSCWVFQMPRLPTISSQYIHHLSSAKCLTDFGLDIRVYSTNVHIFLSFICNLIGRYIYLNLVFFYLVVNIWVKFLVWKFHELFWSSIREIGVRRLEWRVMIFYLFWISVIRVSWLLPCSCSIKLNEKYMNYFDI